MTFKDTFKTPKPIIACVHLMPLPGSPRYSGKMAELYDTALSEVEIFKRYPIDGLIIENFRDMPFYPNKLPTETIAAMAAVTREIVTVVQIPVGVNALRKKISIMGMSMTRYADGKAVEEWVTWDTADQRDQLAAEETSMK